MLASGDGRGFVGGELDPDDLQRLDEPSGEPLRQHALVIRFLDGVPKLHQVAVSLQDLSLQAIHLTLEIGGDPELVVAHRRVDDHEEENNGTQTAGHGIEKREPDGGDAADLHLISPS